MKREEFQPIWDELASEIMNLFFLKNQSYGADDDLHHNFRQTARRILSGQYESEQEDMFRVLACYVDKHWIALCNRGLQDPEFESRCKDIIVYMALAIALYKEQERVTNHENTLSKNRA